MHDTLQSNVPMVHVLTRSNPKHSAGIRNGMRSRANRFTWKLQSKALDEAGMCAEETP